MIDVSCLKEISWEQVLRNLVLFDKFKMRSTGVLVGKCLFHFEKTASLHLYPKSKRFHCYGCGADGNQIEFIANYKYAKQISLTLPFFQEMSPYEANEDQLEIPF